MNIYLSHSSAFDYHNELYKPLKSKLSKQYTIFFPHDEKSQGTKSKDIIANSDIFLAEVSFPSTGQGIEIGWADSFAIPIIYFNSADSQPTSSLKLITNDGFTYTNRDDLITKLEAKLSTFTVSQ